MKLTAEQYDWLRDGFRRKKDATMDAWLRAVDELKANVGAPSAEWWPKARAAERLHGQVDAWSGALIALNRVRELDTASGDEALITALMEASSDAA